MRAAEALIRTLEALDVDTIFGYPGGAIMPIYDALVDSKIRHILTRHEQGAAFAAMGYARATRTVGVAMATSGPGATNLVTAIADAFMDSVPLVAITGQVGQPLMGTDAFQEVDVFGITMPVVKHSFLARKSGDIPDLVREAFTLAASGRPGPVVVDIPKDVANGQCEFTAQAAKAFEPTRADAPDPEDLQAAATLISQAKRPLIYAGGGVINADAIEEFRAFVQAHGIPVVHTLKGIGAIAGDHPLYLGMLGMHGLKNANLSVQESDLLIVIGARFDDRVTGKVAEFAPHARVVHFDIDPAEMGKVRRADVAVVGDLKSALNAVRGRPDNMTPWLARCEELKREYAPRYDAPGDAVFAPAFLRDLSLAAGEKACITCDVGQHQMWVAQHYRLPHPRLHFSSGGLGTMGFGLPTAIGVQLAHPDKTVINVAGDGSFMMNVQELATVKRYNLPVKVVVLDNQALGMVRQWQELFNNKRYSQVSLSDNPDFCDVARAFGMGSFRVEGRADIPAAIDRLVNRPGPMLVHIPIDTAANVWPLVPPGAPNTQMLEESPA